MLGKAISKIIAAGMAAIISIAILAGCSFDKSGSQGTFVRPETDPFSARAAEETAVDIVSYDMDLTLDTDHDRLIQTVKMKVKNNTDASDVSSASITARRDRSEPLKS